MTLLDVSGKSLNLARRKAKEAHASFANIMHANALDLSVLGSDVFDAVLLLGPLNHLLSRDDRVLAIQEAMCALNPGCKLLAAFITRFAPFRYVANGEPGWLVANPEYPRQLLETRIHDRPTQFARAHSVHPDEVLPLMESCGLRNQCLVGVEGVVSGHEEKVNELTEEAWEAWVDLNYQLGQDPTLHGASDHLL